MHPEESPVTAVGGLVTASLARVLPQVLSDHGLCDGLDHARISGWRHINWVSKLSTLNVEAFIEL